MAGEVIRDVVIRVSIQQGQSGGGTAFDQATKGAQATTGAVNTLNQSFTQITNNAVTFGQKAERSLTAMEQELERVKLQIRDVAEGYVFAGQKGGQELDELIAKQKMLQGVIKETEAMIRKAEGVDPKDPKPAGPKLPFGGALQGLEAASGALSKVAIPVAVMSMVPAVADQISGGLRSIGYSLFGTAQERQEKGNTFLNSLGSTDKVAGTSGVGDFIGLALNSAIGRAIADSPLGAVPTFGGSARGIADRFQESRNAAAQNADPNYGQTAFDLLQREVQLREQGVALLEQTYSKQKAALDRELSLTEDRIRMNQAVIEAEEAKLNAAQQQFGMLDATERATFKSAAEKAKEGGLGSLSKEELGLLRGNQAFQGLFQDDAMQAADAAGWKEIVDSLGLDEKIKAEEAQLELNLQQKMEITADLSNIDAAVNKFRDALLESQKKLADEMLTRVRLEIARALRDTKGPSGPDF